MERRKFFCPADTVETAASSAASASAERVMLPTAPLPESVLTGRSSDGPVPGVGLFQRVPNRCGGRQCGRRKAWRRRRRRQMSSGSLHAGIPLGSPPWDPISHPPKLKMPPPEASPPPPPAHAP
eukprot:357847-Chlamydomonas_euryale.AAC.2